MIKRGQMLNNKRGQITVFIIVAVIIVALAILVYFVYPKIKTTTITTNPTEYIQQCMEKEIETNVQKISMQGGSLNPTLYTNYYGEKIEYLCYTNEYFKPCVMQQPMLKNHIEDEIKDSIKNRTKSCFDSLENNYKKQGYEVILNRQNYSVELLPEKIITTFNYDLTLTKGSTNKYSNFKIVLNNNLFELVTIANSILNWEVQFGNADTTIYMTYYHWLKAEKRAGDNGAKIYILTDRDSQNKFEFATRSVVWAAG